MSTRMSSCLFARRRRIDFSYTAALWLMSLCLKRDFSIPVGTWPSIRRCQVRTVPTSAPNQHRGEHYRQVGTRSGSNLCTVPTAVRFQLSTQLRRGEYWRRVGTAHRSGFQLASGSNPLLRSSRKMRRSRSRTQMLQQTQSSGRPLCHQGFKYIRYSCNTSRQIVRGPQQPLHGLSGWPTTHV